ncbi:glycosyltransferase family 2 protein [Acidithiobacillus concretivorus]|uniref:Glycosyltransferase family 2 protein n=1 Tax=Acidithiobacillus concretivorus TaxID=3063952 RepID=A0ABS5ZM25_9PROT|nr:glycosyltransferase family 2 protein [Acidithiobacillus concretivorus]MBU2737238.1 glycosyltransferase family 2 protein [Acidithiobacillus concretivorus]
MNMPIVDIILATFNGESYIDALLDSIFNQTYIAWRLLIRDDCSSDATVTIIKSFADKYPEKIVVLDNKNIRLGVVGNFNALLNKSSARYIMFADQDDIWLPHKIELTLSKAIESDNHDNVPLLVHTDLCVVDKNLIQLSKSFWSYQAIDPARAVKLKDVMIQNVVTGCTMLINRSLAEISMPIPSESKMHDWWIAMVASAFGKIEFIPESTILYRQHGKNDTGAKRWNLYNSFKYIFLGRKLHQRIIDTENQALIFLRAYQDRLTNQQAVTLQMFGTLDEKNFFVRRFIALGLGLRKHKILRSIGLYVFM